MSTTLGGPGKRRQTGHGVILQEQTVLKLELSTILPEVKGMLNAKPLGCVSVDSADPGPVTLHVLHTGRYDSLLPQVLDDNFWSTFVRRCLLCLKAWFK